MALGKTPSCLMTQYFGRGAGRRIHLEVTAMLDFISDPLKAAFCNYRLV